MVSWSSGQNFFDVNVGIKCVALQDRINKAARVVLGRSGKLEARSKRKEVHLGFSFRFFLKSVRLIPHDLRPDSLVIPISN